MRDITITKKDLLWGYMSQFLQMASGLIVLPVILSTLSAEEIGYNYIILTIGSLVALFDFGFSPLYARNISFVFGGAQELIKEGVVVNKAKSINFRLVACMIEVAKMVYRRLSLVALIVMLSLGTWYSYTVTDGFSSIPNSLLIWLIYSISIFFEFYFKYYNSLLIGRGLIMESNKANIASRISYIIIAVVLVKIGLGLLGVVTASFLSPFVSRYVAHRSFYSKELVEKIDNIEITDREKNDAFSTIWFNAKKQGIASIGAYCINKFGMFISGMYLTLSEVASYGLMMQISGIIITLSSVQMPMCFPKISALRIKDDKTEIVNTFSLYITIYYILVVLGSIIFICFGDLVLQLIHSNTLLPSKGIVMLYMMVLILENNHSFFASLIGTGNRILWVKPSLISGAAIVFFSVLSLKFTSLGILGLVLSQGICQAVYSNWKWPYVALSELDVNISDVVRIGLRQIYIKVINYVSFI